MIELIEEINYERHFKNLDTLVLKNEDTNKIRKFIVKYSECNEMYLFEYDDSIITKNSLEFIDKTKLIKFKNLDLRKEFIYKEISLTELDNFLRTRTHLLYADMIFLVEEKLGVNLHNNSYIITNNTFHSVALYTEYSPVDTWFVFYEDVYGKCVSDYSDKVYISIDYKDTDHNNDSYESYKNY